MKILRPATALAATLLVWCWLEVAPAGGAFAIQNQPSFRSTSELVLLNVTVRDRKREFVRDLTSEAFTVYENGRPQPIRFFLSEDAPVTVGLLIDTSGSMLPMRSLVLSAVTAFAETGNVLDEFFAITFDDEVRQVLPAAVPFTRESVVLAGALRGALNPQGRTSLYDAIAQGASYAQRGSHQRKVIVVVSDGADTASVTAFDRVLRQVQASNVVVYGVRLVDPVDASAQAKDLKVLAAATGGELIVARRSDQVLKAFEQVANSIRHAYVLAYEPSEAMPAGRLHPIRVAVNLPGRGKMTAQTRSGYWAEGLEEEAKEPRP